MSGVNWYLLLFLGNAKKADQTDNANLSSVNPSVLATERGLTVCVSWHGGFPLITDFVLIRSAHLLSSLLTALK